MRSTTLERAAGILERMLDDERRCMSAALRRSFSSLEIPNYRRYFAGQLVSLSGNWMQMVAEMWLILELTDSGVAVGVTAALQFLPILVFGAWGGVLADRWPKRSLLIVTQTAMAVPALTLWALTASGTVEPWMVFGARLRPRRRQRGRQPDPPELRDRDGRRRPRGQRRRPQQRPRPRRADPRPGRRRRPDRDARRRALLPDQRRHLRGDDRRPARAWTRRAARAPPAAARGRAAAASARRSLRARRAEPADPAGDDGASSERSAFNFQVLLPLLGRFTFDGGAAAYTALAVAMAVGSVGGALATGARGRISERLLVGASAAFGLFALLAAAAPTLPLAMVALVPLGAASVTFAAGVNSTLQLGASPAMRGRVMALYSVVFLGSTPIGGPIVGWLAEVAGPRAGLVLGGVAALAAAVGGAIAFARAPRPAWGMLGRLRDASAIAALGLGGRRRAASRTGRGRGTGPGCGSASRARRPRRARRRSGPRRGPRSRSTARSRPRQASAIRIA